MDGILTMHASLLLAAALNQCHLSLYLDPVSYAPHQFLVARKHTFYKDNGEIYHQTLKICHLHKEEWHVGQIHTINIHLIIRKSWAQKGETEK